MGEGELSDGGEADGEALGEALGEADGAGAPEAEAEGSGEGDADGGDEARPDEEDRMPTCSTLNADAVGTSVSEYQASPPTTSRSSAVSTASERLMCPP